MVNSALQVCGFVVTLIGSIMAVITRALPVWMKNDLEGEVTETIVRTAGLWVRCVYQATGHWTCSDNDSFYLGLPVSLQGARVATVLAIGAGFIGILLGIIGLDCTTVASEYPRVKSRLVIVAGSFHLFGGVSLGIAVSWFAADVLQDYNNLLQAANIGGTRSVYGEALFVGWVGMVISVLGGVLMCCSSWNADDDDDRRPYMYNPPKPKPAAAECI